jgi:hypothetical protein
LIEVFLGKLWLIRCSVLAPPFLKRALFGICHPTKFISQISSKSVINEERFSLSNHTLYRLTSKAAN